VGLSVNGPGPSIVLLNSWAGKFFNGPIQSNRFSSSDELCRRSGGGGGGSARRGVNGEQAATVASAIKRERAAGAPGHSRGSPVQAPRDTIIRTSTFTDGGAGHRRQGIITGLDQQAEITDPGTPA
jgi:hypothetical protein